MTVRKDRSWLTAPEAARQAEVTRRTMIQWCHRDPVLAWRPAPRSPWRIDPDILAATLSRKRQLGDPAPDIAA
jgi:hypothetical protein